VGMGIWGAVEGDFLLVAPVTSCESQLAAHLNNKHVFIGLDSSQISAPFARIRYSFGPASPRISMVYWTGDMARKCFGASTKKQLSFLFTGINYKSFLNKYNYLGKT